MQTPIKDAGISGARIGQLSDALVNSGVLIEDVLPHQDLRQGTACPSPSVASGSAWSR
jgi:hypothetical protein